jgi:predicted nucleotidyltransferase
MKDISHDISKKIDKQTLHLLTAINEKADSMGINYFIIGAVARDILLHYEFGMPIERKTNDIDLSIKIKNWDEFNLFVNNLKSEGLIEDTNVFHRYLFDKISLIDIIPFGSIANDHNEITWPDADKTKMTIIGFEESYNNSEQVIINHNPETIIRFASLDGLVVLKLLAWNDKYPGRRKDAQDLYYIISKYISAGNLDRLYNENSDLIELTPGTFDEKLLGARLIGRDITKWVAKNTYNKITGILSTQIKENAPSKLVLDIMRNDAVREDYEKDYSYYFSIISQLLNGLKD